MSIRPSVKEKVGLNVDDLKYIAGKSTYTYKEVVNIIRDLLSKVLKYTIQDIELWIDHKVPKRTGALRQNLKLSLRSSQVIGNILKIIIGTSIEYAERVNEYTTRQVRHYNTRKEHSGKKVYAHGVPVTLNDPEAVGHFFDRMLEFVEERVLINLSKAKYEIETSTKLTSRQLTRVEVK